MTQQTINYTELKKTNSYNLKNVDEIRLQNFGDFVDKINNVSVADSTLTIALEGNKTIKFTNISNPKGINITGDYEKTLQGFYNEVYADYNWIPQSAKITKVVGSVFDENIYVEEYNLSPKGLTINAGAGDDTITGTLNNDTITGGLGKNYAVYTKSNFGTDTIKLTAKEDFVLDATAFGFENLNDFKAGTEVKVNGSALDIKFGNYGTVKLANFAQSNAVGIDGSVRVLLKNETAPGLDDAVYVNLNTDNVLEYENADFDAKGSFKGSRFSEEITAENLGKAVTIDAKDGYNAIDLSDNTASSDKITGGNDGNNIVINKDGDKTVTTGAGDDAILINGNGAHTIKAGDGNNHIEITGDGIKKITTGKGNDDITISDTTQKVTIKAGETTDALAPGYNDITLQNATGINSVDGGKGNDILQLDNAGTTTAKLGDGDNQVTVTGAGKHTIVMGKDKDVVNINDSTAQAVIQAGKGENTINIQNSNFGEIILKEEKANATNIINFEQNIDETYTVTKKGNAIVISNATSSIQIDEYVNQGTGKYANIKFKVAGVNKTLDDIVDMTGKNTAIEGSGKFDGTDANDSITGSVKADTINGFKGNDTINGLDGNDNLFGNDGDDYLYGGDGKDNLNGGAGTNTYVFEGTNFGSDTITLSNTENAVIDFSGLAGITQDNITCLLDNNNLVIRPADYGQVTIANFKKEDITGANGSVNLRLSDSIINLKELLYSVTPKSSYTGTWLAEDIDISQAKSAATINAGKGNDIITSGTKADTFVFVEGDGQDTIKAATSDDKIQINTVISEDNINIVKSNDDLIVNYTDNDNITIKDYFNSNSKIESIQLKQENGKYETVNISEKLVQNNILDIEDDTVISISADSQYEALNFVSAQNADNIHYEIKNNDLKMTYRDAVVTLEGYMNGNHNTKQLIVRGATYYDIAYHAGTDGNDTMSAQNISEHFFLKGGNDTISFNGTDFTSDNFIISEGTQNNTTTLNFDNYALSNDEMKFDYNVQNGTLTIHAEKREEDGMHGLTSQYEGYFNDNKPTALIKDSTNKTFGIDKVKTASNQNWSSNDEKDNNHVSFLLASSGTNNVISNDETNIIYATKGANTNYTYKGGKDKIDTDWALSNDTYNIDSFDSNTHLVLTDKGGDDTINFTNTESDNIRLLFDVEYNEGTTVASFPSALVNSEVFNVSTLKNYLSDVSGRYSTGWQNGVIKVNTGAFTDNGTDSGIETVTATDGAIELDSWKSAIATTVCDWFENLVETHQITYSTRPTLSGALQHGEISDAQLTDLLGMFNVKYSEIPQEDPDDDYEQFIPNYECDEQPNANNTYVINPTAYMYVSAEGNDLVFTYWNGDGNTVKKIENYFTGESPYKYISVSGQDPEVLAEYAHVQIGTDKKEIFTGTEDGDIIFAGAGNDKISAVGGQGGMINYVNPGEGNNKIYMSDEHWEETHILNGNGEDTIVFPEGSEINMSTDQETGLTHFTYMGEIPLDEPNEYGEETRQFGGDAVIDLNDTSVKFIQIGDNKPVSLDSYTSTLFFEEGTALEFGVSLDGKDLTIETWVDGQYNENGKTRLANYFKGENPYKYVKIGNNDIVSIDTLANIQYGTEQADTMNGTTYVEEGETFGQDDILVAKGGNDTITAGEGNDNILAGTGDDTIVFGKQYHRDVIFSENALNQTNTDILVFQNHSLAQGSLSFEYGSDEELDENWNPIYESKDLRIYGGHGGPDGDEEAFGGDIIYRNYFGYESGKWNTPSITIQDANNDTYNVDRHLATITEDWSNSNTNKVSFILAEQGESTIISNSDKFNFIYKSGGASLDYTYTGGGDTVNSASYEDSANDTYRINSFTTNTTLDLSDAGGLDDELIINGSSDNMRLVFGGGEYGLYRYYNEYDQKWYWNGTDDWYGINLVHADNLTFDNFKAYATNTGDLNGIYMNVDQDIIEQDEYGQDVVMGSRCGLETVKTTDYQNGIDMDAWKNQIVANIQAWFSDAQHPERADYNSVYEVFEKGSEAEQISLANCYDVSYTQAMM